MTFPGSTSPSDSNLLVAMRARPMQPSDVEACGRVAFEAHQAAARAHGLPPEQSSLDFSIGWMSSKLADANARGLVAERGGVIVGSVFLNTFPPASVAAIGPLTVHPEAQGDVGSLLIENALEHARRSGFDRVRLVQSPAHLRSLVLCSRLGFAVREPLILMQGNLPSPEPTAGRIARAAMQEDLFACNDVYARLHGFSREFELRAAFEHRTLTVVTRDDKIVGYATGVGFRGHAAAETLADLKLVLCAAPKLPGPGFFVPARNSELLRWLLECGAKALWPATLMTRGPYRDASGAFVPSIAF